MWAVLLSTLAVVGGSTPGPVGAQNEPVVVTIGLQAAEKNLNPLRFSGRRSAADVRALRGLSLSIRRGELLAVVGRSGVGKRTLARVACGAVPHRRDARALPRVPCRADSDSGRPSPKAQRTEYSQRKELRDLRDRIGERAAALDRIDTELADAGASIKVRQTFMTDHAGDHHRLDAVRHELDREIDRRVEALAVEPGDYGRRVLGRVPHDPAMLDIWKRGAPIVEEHHIGLDHDPPSPIGCRCSVAHASAPRPEPASRSSPSRQNGIP